MLCKYPRCVYHVHCAHVVKVEYNFNKWKVLNINTFKTCNNNIFFNNIFFFLLCRKFHRYILHTLSNIVIVNPRTSIVKNLK